MVGDDDRAGLWSFWRHRASGDASTLDRGSLLRSGSLTRIIRFYGNCYSIGARRSGRGPGLIVIRLPDGRERAISRLAMALASASDDRRLTFPSGQAHISVRTLLPLGDHVRAVLASRHADLEGGGGRDLDRRRRSRPGRETAPRLWPQLPLETKRQLAQRVGQLVHVCDRVRPLKEGHRADHDVIDG